MRLGRLLPSGSAADREQGAFAQETLSGSVRESPAPSIQSVQDT